MLLSRRQFLQATGAVSALFPLAALANVPFSLGEAHPRLPPPEGSVDCHMHLYDSRIPAAPDATLLPPDASIDDYRKLQQRLSIGRMVIVTPSTYGTDNRVMLDGLKRSCGAARGVAVVDAAITETELAALHKAGVRGIRFNLSMGGASLEHLETLAAKVGQLGWNVQLATGPRLAELAPRLIKLPGKIVIDHMGHVPQPEGLNSAAFASLERLLDTGRVWVKLSAPYLRSKAGAPTYQDVGKVASKLISLQPQRILWGSDWPHPTLPQDQKPDDAALLDLLMAWSPDNKTRTLILRDNPVSLYGF
ncbi:amidohydrolase family protein [Pseudomonas putida]